MYWRRNQSTDWDGIARRSWSNGALSQRRKHATIVVLKMPLPDTRSNRDLTGTFIADIVLQLLSYVAQTERAFIRRSQREGIEAAHARGRRFGRPPKKRPPELEDDVDLWTEGKISAREAARRLQLVHTNFLSWARKILMERGYSNCERDISWQCPCVHRIETAFIHGRNRHVKERGMAIFAERIYGYYLAY